MIVKIAIFGLFGLSLTLGLFACDDDSSVNTVDQDSFAVVEATVLDPASLPLPSAEVKGIGHAAPCHPPADPGPVAGTGATDGSGWVRLHLVGGLSQPGIYCVSFVVAAPGENLVDTVGVFEVAFYSNPILPDTTVLTVQVSQ